MMRLPCRRHHSLGSSTPSTGTDFQSLGSTPAAYALVSLSHIHIALCLGRLQRLTAAPPSWFIFQPRQPFLHKPLYPLVGMVPAQANGRRNGGNRHPLSQEAHVQGVRLNHAIFASEEVIFSRLGVKDGQKCPFKDSNVVALMLATPCRVAGDHPSLTLFAKILLHLVSPPWPVGWDTALFAGKCPMFA